MSNKRVFLSYSRENSDLIQPLSKDIQQLGVDLWYDQDLSGGQAWWNAILTQIRACDVFVQLVAEETLDSPACRRELDYAKALGKSILPVLAAGELPVGSPVAALQYIDYREGGDGVIALAKALLDLPDTPPLPDPLPEPPITPKTYAEDLFAGIQDSLDKDSLSFEEQAAILMKLKGALGQDRGTQYAKKLVDKFTRRVDLNRTIADELSSLGRALGDKPKEETPAVPEEPTDDAEGAAETQQPSGVPPTTTAGRKPHGRRLLAVATLLASIGFGYMAAIGVFEATGDRGPAFFVWILIGAAGLVGAVLLWRRNK